MNGDKEGPLNEQSFNEYWCFVKFELASYTTRNFVEVLFSRTTPRWGK